MLNKDMSFLVTAPGFVSALFILIIGSVVQWAMVAYVLGVTQTRHAVRRSYPVIGRFRCFSEHLGEFFRQCNRNTCPTGITTHDPKLQKGLHPPTKAEHVASYVNNMVYEVGMLTH